MTQRKVLDAPAIASASHYNRVKMKHDIFLDYKSTIAMYYSTKAFFVQKETNLNDFNQTAGPFAIGQDHLRHPWR